ncbi:PaaI family thioesterase [Paenibacillus marinisediminis]
MELEAIMNHPYYSKLASAAKNTFWEYLGCNIEEISDKHVVVSLDIKQHHLNLIGILHGGVHATMIDSAMGLIVMLVRPNESVVTTNLNLNYLAPMSEGRIYVTAELVHSSRKMMTAQASARKENGELCATGTGTFRVIDRPVTSSDSGGDTDGHTR